MTFNVGSVEGGTHAGTKRQKPAPKPWEHKCPDGTASGRMAAHWAHCPYCGTRRPAYTGVSHTEV